MPPLGRWLAEKENAAACNGFGLDQIEALAFGAWLEHRGAAGFTEQQGRDAVAEMLGVIEKRLAKINAENAVEATTKT